MFCACVGILVCLVVIVVGASISMLNLKRYDFGLYYVLLAVVAMIVSATVCVIRPKKCCGCSDPRWYTRCCQRIHLSLVEAQERRLAQQSLLDAESSGQGGLARKSHQMATLRMLGPAVVMMRHIIHGVNDDGDESPQGRSDDGPVIKSKKAKKRRKKARRTAAKAKANAAAAAAANAAANANSAAAAATTVTANAIDKRLGPLIFGSPSSTTVRPCQRSISALLTIDFDQRPPSAPCVVEAQSETICDETRRELGPKRSLSHVCL